MQLCLHRILLTLATGTGKTAAFALPLLDLIADAVTGWVPEVPGLEFATGFELDNERFVQVTEASQFSVAGDEVS